MKRQEVDKTVILDRISQMVKPLNPPVDAFENSAKRTPFKTLISVLLSSRTKDPVTHKASDNLFSIASTPNEMVLLDEDRIAQAIFPVGFYRQKAKNIKTIARILTQSYNNNIPSTFDELTALPGVGRKTANLVLSLAFNQPSIAVDIHVFRISQRLGWAKGNKPEEIEEQLKQSFAPQFWNRINQVLVGFGQTICKPVNPLCSHCEITEHCLYFNNLEKSAKNNVSGFTKKKIIKGTNQND